MSVSRDVVFVETSRFWHSFQTLRGFGSSLLRQGLNINIEALQ